MAFHLSDLLFWVDYYRTAQDNGLLTIAVGQRRPVWIDQTCIVQRQYLSQTRREVELKIDHYVLRPQLWPLELLGLDALIRETYSSWPWPIPSKESALVALDWFLELLGLDALIRETYSSWPWPILSKESALVVLDHFTSEDDKLKARQTKEGIHKSELKRTLE